MDDTLRKYGRQDNKEEDTDGDTNKAGRKAFKTWEENENSSLQLYTIR